MDRQLTQKDFKIYRLICKDGTTDCYIIKQRVFITFLFFFTLPTFIWDTIGTIAYPEENDRTMIYLEFPSYEECQMYIQNMIRQDSEVRNKKIVKVEEIKQ